MGALSSAVTGLNVHQIMLDVAGNNLANVNTIGYKKTSTQFADLLSQTLRKASGPSANTGGTNPQQIGSGVGISSINRDMSQGGFMSTGSNLDAAISGEGYFALTNAQGQSVYTRMGSFSVDSSNNLVDAATGYMVQRTGSYGALFQGNSSTITVPYGTPMAAQATSTLSINGNLRYEVPTSITGAATKHKQTSTLAFTKSSGTPAVATDTIELLDQWAPASGDSTGTFTINCTAEDGTTGSSVVVAAADDMTLDDLFTAAKTGALANSTMTIDTSGNLVLTADSAGYNEAQITSITYAAGGGGDFNAGELPSPFVLNTAGGEDTHTFTRDIYDSMGAKHTFTGTFVKDSGAANTWDLVIPSITGETNSTSEYSHRRISGIEFKPINEGGAFNGFADPSTSLSFSAIFSANPTVTQDITLSLGTEGTLDGLTQFSSPSSNAGVSMQDGYSAGVLSDVSIDNSGMLVGKFTNDKTVTIAALKMAIFQNPAALEASGGGYYSESANSGVAGETIAGANGAGSIESGQLEQSNSDVATEFVNLMQAQNGFQANARTIRVANDVLRELTGLIR